MTDPFGGFDPNMLNNVPLFRELAKVMSWRGGPVNWDLALQTAESVIASEQGGSGQPELESGEASNDELQQAVGVAELWLDQITDMPAVDGPVEALDRSTWTRRACTSEGLGVYVEPIAHGMNSALSKSLPEELQAMGGSMGQALESMGAMLYGLQVGMIAGHLGGQLLGTYDLAVPTLDPRTVGTVGATAESFAGDYGFDQVEFRHWLMLREAAHRRQFAGVSWLREHVAGLVGDFASEAEFDPEQLMEQFGGLGMGEEGAQSLDPEALQEALGQSDSFRIEPTSAQQAILSRLQALVSFTEGWVNTVIAAAAADKLTDLPRIEEAISRRRATKGPGERFMEQLVGLDLQPKDVRLGRSFCDAVIAARGQAGLDRAWRAPEYLPTQEELEDPSRWLVRMAAAELEE